MLLCWITGPWGGKLGRSALSMVRVQTYVLRTAHRGQAGTTRLAGRKLRSEGNSRELREAGGAPGNPAPGSHCLVRIVKSPGCHCRDALGGKEYRRVPTPLRNTSIIITVLLRSMTSIMITIMVVVIMIIISIFMIYVYIYIYIKTLLI